MSKSFQLCEVTGLDKRIARSSVGDFSTETCSFDISLNNDRCSGKGLECVLAWANGQFKGYEFSLADTLYANSFLEFGNNGQAVSTLASAFALSRKKGDDWLHANEPTISRYLGSNYRIRRWDGWLAHPEIASSIKRVENLFSHPQLAPLVEADATAYLRRRFETQPISERQVQVLIDFMVEECAVYYLHSRDNDVRHVYPGKSLAVLRALSRKDFDLDDPAVADHEMLSVFKRMKRTDIDMRFPDAYKV